MNISIAPDKFQLGRMAAAAGAEKIQNAIQERGLAHIILATGTSQFETLNALVVAPGIDWSKTVLFHLDEYIGLPESHAASFRKYLQERFISKIPTPKAVYLINGEADPQMECERLNQLITRCPIDLALVGIGENGHLAFNDPPADFNTTNPYIVVTLDEPCRKQQMGEGWFTSIDEVPRQAISMSVNQIMQSTTIICSVPDERKAEAVKNTLQQKVSNLYPASILQQHPACTIYLDKASSSLL